MSNNARSGEADAPSREIGTSMLLGVVVLILYAGLYVWEKEILSQSIKGGWSFIIPIVIAFVFSTVHGVFTSKFWTAVGLVAKK